MKFLLADSDSIRSRSIRTILSAMGHKAGDVDSVEDGESALNALKRKKFDVAIVSADLSKMDGITVIKEMRASMALKSLPAILLSSQPSRELVIEAMSSGASSFLGHPCSVADLEDALGQALRKKKA